MLRIVEQITEQLLKRLPSHTHAYTLEELRKAGFPLFLVEKIHSELLLNLAESMALPETEWANMDSDRVHAAWQGFLATIEAEVLLPESYKRSVIENAVEHVLEQLVTPRKELIELIFGTDKGSKDLETIRKHSEEFVVYPYLGRALTRYLERKNQSAINREKAELIISKVDERVTGHYTPLNWGQILEPWFDLMGDDIDTDFLRQFFEDKGLEKNAAIFESAPDKVNRAQFIELLTTGPRIEEESLPVEEETSEASDQAEETVPEVEPEQPEAVDDEEQVEKQPDEDEIVFTLNNKGSKELTGQKEAETDEDQPVSADEKNEEGNSDVSISKKFESEKEEGDLPIWQKFLSASDEEQKEEDTFYNSLIKDDDEAEEQNGPSLADTFIGKNESEEEEEPISGRTDLKSSQVYQLLGDREQSFIKNIFHGDTEAYINTLDRLSDINNWREASAYLYREVFKHHGVSLYSDEAIEFTDRLQRWYQKKSQE